MGTSTDGLLQLLRYGIIGVTTNALLYGGYLVLSSLGIGAKMALSLLYVPGVLVGFAGNRKFTFQHRGRIPASMARYLATYAFGYVFNFAGIVIFVDVLGLPTNWVVFALIFVTAGLLFTLQRWWVFPTQQFAAIANNERGRE